MSDSGLLELGRQQVAALRSLTNQVALSNELLRRIEGYFGQLASGQQQLADDYRAIQAHLATVAPPEGETRSGAS